LSSIQIFSLALLAAAFAIAIWRHMNVGLVTIPAGFLLSMVAGVPVTEYFAHFPGSLVILIIGVTFLFGHAQRSGAIDRITDVAVSTTGRRDWLLPWIMFLLAGILSGIGALPAAALAIVVPIAMRTAVRREINLMLMGLVTISGALAGGFSPISVWGQLVTTATAKANRSISDLGLFGVQFALNLAVAAVAFMIFGGLRLLRRRPDSIDRSAGTEQTGTELAPSGGSSVPGAGRGPRPGSGSDVETVPSESGQSAAVRLASKSNVAIKTATSRASAYEVASLVGIAIFVAVVLIFNVDVGLTAFAAGLVLQIIFRPDEKDVIRSLPWSVVLVITGVLLYVGLLEQTGTFDAIAGHLQGISSLALTILAIAFVGSLFASFESSAVAVLGLIVPVALQVTPGVDGIGLLMILCAVCWAVVIVNPSPYHLSGGLVLASSPAKEQPRLFRGLLLWSFAVAVLAPLAGWLLPTLVS
jgi:di/tricarboxylate transporter